MTTDIFQKILNENLIIIYLDLDGNIVHANDKLFELSLYSESELVGESYTKVISISTPEVDIEDIKQGHTFKGIVKCKDVCQVPTYLVMDIIPIDKNGDITELLCIGIDITKFELQQKQKDKSIIVSRTKSMEKKHSEIATMRQEIMQLEKLIDDKEHYIKEQESTIQQVSQEKKRSDSLVKKLKSISIDLPDVLLDLEISRCRRYHTPLSLAVCTIDFYKDIKEKLFNENLKEMLDAIKKKVTKNIRDTDYISLNDDTFLIVLTNTNISQAKQFADKVKDYFTENKFHYKDIFVTLSYGLLEFDPKSDKVAFLSKASTIANDLHILKTRNTIKIYDVKKENTQEKQSNQEEGASGVKVE